MYKYYVCEQNNNKKSQEEFKKRTFLARKKVFLTRNMQKMIAYFLLFSIGAIMVGAEELIEPKATCYGQFSSNYNGQLFGGCYFFTGRFRKNFTDALDDCRGILYTSGLVQPKFPLGQDDLYKLYKALPSTIYYFWVY